MRSPLLTLLLFTLLCTSGRAQKAGTDYAFLFYTADYTNGWTDLPEVQEDVYRLKNELESNYGFQVEEYGDLSLIKMKQALAEINSRTFGPKDQVLFYFTGHGFYQEGSRNGYLIPVDGQHEWSFGEGWLSYNKLKEYLSHNQAQHVLVAFDACYSGSFGEQTKGAPGALPWAENADCETINRNSLRYKSRLFFTSGSKDERVPKQSEFLSRWLQCLRELPSQEQYVISNDELRVYINTVTASSPESGTFGDHEESGKFVFLHKNACSSEEEPLQAADNAHWAGVQQIKTLEKANEHIKLYGNCSHYGAALQLLSGGSTITQEEIVPEGMIAFSGGTFQMGDTFNEGLKDEKPVHIITVSSLQMGRYQVTYGEYDKFTKATGKKQAQDNFGRGKYPIVNVSWFDAISYCNWRSQQEGFAPVYRLTAVQKNARWEDSGYSLELEENEGVAIDWNANGYRLPTEAEWEFAASYVDGGRKARFGNGKDILRDSEANFNAAAVKNPNFESGILRDKTVRVGSLNSPNELGIHGLVGNVWEWCSDWYDENYYENSQGANNPNGPLSGSTRVMRGGSRINDWSYCRTATRHRARPSGSAGTIGFRVVRSPKR